MGQAELEHATDSPRDNLPRGPLTRAQARRERLIATARVLFAERGFHATGIAEIAKRSQIAVGQIYRDFANKEEIVAAIVERDLADYLNDAALRQALESRDAAAVRGWITRFVAGDKDRTAGLLVAEIMAESSRNDRIASISTSIQERVHGALEEALAVLAPGEDKARRRALLTEVILTIGAGLFHRRLAHGELDPHLIAALTRSIAREIDLLLAD